ncbi:MAG: methyltransferase domain-containing protein [Vicinamibacterales bacterium]|jgi:SAM-dependent methyltransferase|nr:methyltransferase domain-containing protein [Vicinamibacterales bacterium]
MDEDVRALVCKPEFPRASAYDVEWMLDHQMGPNAVWLAEWLCAKLPLAPGMRVLDLGCGKAMTSVFLAREFGVQVHALDLWMSPDHNFRRAQAAGVGHLVCPVKGEAHALPFAQGYFDAVVSIDAYQYFGTDDLYLDYLAGFVRPGGWLGVAAVGLARPLEGGVPPAHLTRPQSNGKVFWEPGCRCFKTPGWWRELWAGSPMVEGVEVDLMPEGCRHWRDFERAIELSGKGFFPSDAEALEEDADRTLAFVRLVARRTALAAENFYDASLGARLGVDR